MKTTLLIIAAALAISCGRRESSKQKTCLSRYQKMMECFQAYNRTHHPDYVNRVCGEKYPEEGCYQ